MALDKLAQRFTTVAQNAAFAGVVAMLVLVFATIADVVLRWLFSKPIVGLNEIVGMGMGVAVAASFPAGAMQRVNLTIELLQNVLAARVIGWLKVAAHTLLLLFYGLMAWQVWVYAGKLAARAAETVYLKLPTAPFIYAIAAFFAVAAIAQILIVILSVRSALTGEAGLPGWSMESEAPGGEKKEAAASQPTLSRVLAASGLVFVVAGLIIWAFVAMLPTMSTWAQDNKFTFGIIVIAALWLLLVLYIPLAVVMGLLGLVAALLFMGTGPALSVLGNESMQFLTNYSVAVLPMFLMMGSFAVVAGMSGDIYELAHTLLSRRRGGLALATIGGCAGFGALTGSSLATVATIGRVAMPEMVKRGYAPGLAAGTVAAGGTLGALVPPSIPLVFFALLTEASIGQLFIAAVIPAILGIALYLAAIAIYVRVVPNAAPTEVQSANWSEIGRAFVKAWSTLLLLTVVVGSIYTGICTETEAAAIGAGGAFIAALARGKITRDTLLRVMGETTATTALIYLIITGVLLFTFAMGVTGLPQQLTEAVKNLNLPSSVILVMILIVYLFLGAIMDSNTVMFVTIPIVTPVIIAMGYDLVWWGIINLIILEVGLITPPFGIHLFVLKSITGGNVPLSVVYRGVLPFCYADFTKLVLLVSFPALALWLPQTMMR
jgi:tripartite ATP-independent transporter DctM subunit